MGLELTPFKVSKSTKVDYKFWNQLIDTMELRFLDVATKATQALASSDVLVTQGLARIDEVLLPVFQRISEVAGIGAMFSATSQTSFLLQTGQTTFLIGEAEREIFAPTAFLYGFKDGDKTKAWIGQLVSYSGETGNLVVDVLSVYGTGEHGDWKIHPATGLEAADQAARAETAADEAVAARDATVAAKDTTIEFATGAGVASEEAIAARDVVVASLEGLDLYYLGAKATDPVTSNTGGALVVGMQYFNTTAEEMRVYKGVGDGWVAEYVPAESAVSSVFGRSGAVGAGDGDYNAAQVVVTPVGGISSDRVQAALEELDTEKASSAAVAAALAGKSDTGHGHAIADVTGLQTALDGKSATGHTHAIADVTNLQTTLDGKSATGHGHAITDVTGLQTALDGKSATGHQHAISDVTGLQAVLDGKSATGHSHAIADVTGLEDALASAGGGYDILLDEVSLSGTNYVITAATIAQAYKRLELTLNGAGHNNGTAQSARVYISGDDGVGYSAAMSYAGSVAGTSSIDAQITITNADAASGNRLVVTGHFSSSDGGTRVFVENITTGYINNIKLNWTAGSFDMGTVTLIGWK